MIRLGLALVVFAVTSACGDGRHPAHLVGTYHQAEGGFLWCELSLAADGSFRWLEGGCEAPRGEEYEARGLWAIDESRLALDILESDAGVETLVESMAVSEWEGHTVIHLPSLAHVTEALGLPHGTLAKAEVWEEVEPFGGMGAER